jgi:GNAT superfamily N-acetyltransferase
MLMLRNPEPHEAAALTDLCLRSKAVWGYDERFMEACRRELTFAPADIRSPGIQVAVVNGRLIGVGVVEVTPGGEIADLAKLFVEPTKLRAGAGRQIFKWAKAAARANGANALVIDADPHAANFYRKMGAVDDGVVPSTTIPGRSLPRLVIQL